MKKLVSAFYLTILFLVLGLFLSYFGIHGLIAKVNIEQQPASLLQLGINLIGIVFLLCGLKLIHEAVETGIEFACSLIAFGVEVGKLAAHEKIELRKTQEKSNPEQA